jgi:REP element-mobilizing transposase RayT
MPQSLSKVYIHLTFSTKKRIPFLSKDIEPRLWHYMGGVLNRIKCQPIQVGGHCDHAHVLCVLHRTVTQATLVSELKKHSSSWIKTVDDRYWDFYWQDGYSVFSVNPTQIDRVVQYIRNQEEHHTNRSFQDELRLFLKKYGVAYDERYVWD